jgi:hypothetical protein
MGILLGFAYFLASRHIIIHETEFAIIKKDELTFEYTFVNLTNRRVDDIMRNDTLREAGIGDVMVDLGLISEGKKIELENWYGFQD